jgi:hemoglobin-like flavoprotein
MSAAPSQVDAFHASLARASSDPRFLDVFYARFIGSSRDVAVVFAGKDMEQLKRKLRSSLHVMTLAVDGAPGADMYLDYLGKIHTRLDIAPRMYDTWLDALVATAAECDPQFTRDLDAVWRAVVGAGVRMIKDAATEAPASPA